MLPSVVMGVRVLPIHVRTPVNGGASVRGKLVDVEALLSRRARRHERRGRACPRGRMLYVVPIRCHCPLVFRQLARVPTTPDAVASRIRMHVRLPEGPRSEARAAAGLPAASLRSWAERIPNTELSVRDGLGMMAPSHAARAQVNVSVHRTPAVEAVLERPIDQTRGHDSTPREHKPERSGECSSVGGWKRWCSGEGAIQAAGSVFGRTLHGPC